MTIESCRNRDLLQSVYFQISRGRGTSQRREILIYDILIKRDRDYRGRNDSNFCNGQSFIAVPSVFNNHNT